MKPSEAEVKTSLSTALSGATIRDICRNLTQIINSCDTQNLETLFHDIMDDIILKRPFKWGLKSENLSREDSFCVRDFMGLQGPLFRLVQRMMQHGMQCVVPIPYYSEYHEGPNRMSPFEAFFVYLAHFITVKPAFVDIGHESCLPTFSQHNSSIQNLEEAPYFLLLGEYFSYYFPMTSDTKSPSLNLGMPLKSSPKPYRSIAQSRSLLRHNASKITSSHGETLSCDVLAQLFSKLWMEDYFNKIGGAMERKIPTQNHVRAIRLLVKHVHFFFNAHTENIRQLRSESLWEQVNSGIMNKFAPKLYDFLLHCFEIWPRDQSFRIVLETWLSFIQPWRYVSKDGIVRSDAAVSNDWYWFVYQHLRFYSSLFQAAIKRLKCTDLGTPANSFLLSRVAKVFKQANLITLIDQAQENSIHEMSRSYGSYLMTSSNSAKSDDGMFSREFTDIVAQLMDTISQILETLRDSTDEGDTNDFSSKTLKFFGYGALLDSSSDRNSVTDAENTKQNLKSAMTFLSDTFDLPVPKLAASRPVSPDGKPEIADHHVDDDGRILLSPTGRYQLRNNLRKFPVTLNTDPELWPICGYECAFLVRFFFALSSKFNRKYRSKMDALCRERTFVGKACRWFCVPRIDATRYRVNKRLEPRLSLRFLAHYRNLVGLFTVFLFLWLFGFSFPKSLFYVLGFTAIVVFIQILFSSDDVY